MTLSQALDIVYGPGVQWPNPIRPYFVSTVIPDTPYQAWAKLKPEFQEIVVRLIGHQPKRDEE